ncbi:uncharacterized protein LOC135687800 [Rhopilema esculentum]|uniref:uncharacterized protein LOC135687800 n=1 Tax=Rhopilema esculentum TaxID=499914 RepID=UPI0031D0749B
MTMIRTNEELNSMRTPLLHDDALASEEQSLDPVYDAALDVETFTMHYIQFKRNVLKSQQRADGQSMQRIRKQDSTVVIEIAMLTLSQVADIKVYVKRIKEIVNPPIGSVELEVEKKHPTCDKYELTINLDSVFSKDGRPVYALAKSNTEERNLFFLRVEVIFIDGSKSSQNTEPFKIVGKMKEVSCQKEPDEGDHLEQVAYQPLAFSNANGHGKKRKSDSIETVPHADSLERILQFLKEGEPLSAGPRTSLCREKLIEASKIVSEEIRSKTAFIEQLYGVQQINTPRGDIAYHFVIRNPSDCPFFKEGEIVGIFEGINKEAVLDKLSSRNAQKSITRGVITRSHYIAAKTKASGITETICMFGVVPVRVKGSVASGEALYCSEIEPGVAVSGRQLKNSQTIPNALIGIALETSGGFYDEIHLVESLVSLTMEVFGNLMDRNMKQINRNIDSKVDSIKKSRKRLHKRLRLCFGISFVFCSLLAILFWQLFVPCSAFKYWQCRQGMIAKQQASFSYRELSTAYKETKISGIEFTWEKLIKKTDLGGAKAINSTGFHYYLNLKVCACGDKAAGPSAFAADVSCTHLYFYSSSCMKWCRYYSAKNIVCHPFYPWGSMSTLLKEKLCWITATLKWYCLV